MPVENTALKNLNTGLSAIFHVCMTHNDKSRGWAFPKKTVT